MGQVILIHGVEDTPVNGLQAVPHIGQGPAHDDGHGIFDVALLHLGNEGGVVDDLVRITKFLRVHVVSLLGCHLCSSLLEVQLLTYIQNVGPDDLVGPTA